MLYNVFNKRKKVQKKITNIAPARRAPSPPSPASFASPDVVEIQDELANSRFAAAAQARLLDGSGRAYTPQLPLELPVNYRESYSDWFPADLLRHGARTPPERNASLLHGGGGSGSIHGTSGDGYSRTGTPEASFTSSADDIIIIEPARPEGRSESRELPPLPIGDSDSDVQGSLETNSNPSVSRKPTPTPIKIPANPTGSKIRITHSASAGTSAGPSTHLPVPSRPSSPNSTCTDDLSSSVSGTTLARALVANSFILTNDSRGSRYRSGVTRQDSATLPRGEHPFQGRYGVAGTNTLSPDTGDIPPVPPLPSSAELSVMGLDGAWSAGGSGSRSRRSSTSVVYEKRGTTPEAAESTSAGPSRRSSISGGTREREQAVVFSPISPISEAPSPVPSAPNTPTSFVKSASQRRSVTISEGRAESLVRQEGHQRASTESPRPSFDEGRRESEKHRPDLLALKNALLSPMSESGTSASVYSAASFDRASISTPGTSLKSPRSASQGSPFVSRSHSDSSAHAQRNASGPSRTLLPIGERPHSVLAHVPQSPISARTSSDSDLRRPYAGLPNVPVTARLPGGDTPVDSPDLLDIMFPVAPPSERSGRGRERNGGQLAPLAIVPGAQELPTPVLSSGTESLTMMSSNHQTFPETPYAFSPLLSAGIMSPVPPPPPPMGGGRALPRTMTMHRPSIAEKLRFGQGQRMPLMRATTAPSGGRAPPALPTPPSSVDSVYGSSTGQGEPSASAESELSAQNFPPLSSIEEAYSTPSHSPSPEPRSRNVSVMSRAETPSHGANDLAAANRAAPGDMLLPSPRFQPSSPPPTTPLPPPPPPQEEMQGGSPPPAYAYVHEAASSSTGAPSVHVRSESTSDSEGLSRQSSVQSNATQASQRSSIAKPRRSFALTPLPSPPPSAVPLPPSPMPPSPMPSIEEHSVMEDHPPPPPYAEEMQRADVPAPPMSLPAVTNTVPSRVATPELQVPKRTARTRPPLPIGPRKPLVSTRSRTGSVSSSVSGPSSMRRPSMPTLSASAPRFQTTPVKFRGLTKEAAEWTFSSQQLQQLVSTAIRQTADISAIRLLPLAILNNALPDEINRLEALSAELRTNYKLTVRRRRMLLGSLSSMMDGSEPSESAATARMLEELSDLTDSLDQITEELYDVTTQLGQLNHLRDVHSSSALMMALHKLNKSLKKHLEEGQKLREQVTTLEEERDEAWRQAQEVAQDFDDLAERTDQPFIMAREASVSRRCSRVVLARKNSARVAKAGLRTSMHRRSQRSSVSSGHQNTAIQSPAVRSALFGDVPPVPPIPPRSGLGIMTDLPSSRTGLMSDTPSSEFRAMTEAQKELCEMLGISLDDLKSHQPSRHQSMSGMVSKSPLSPSRTRRNSDGLMMVQRTPASTQIVFGL